MSNEELRIGHLSTAYHTNYILMNDKKFLNVFENKVCWELFGTGPLMIEAFEKRLLDIGYLGLPPAIIGIDQGIPIKCVAGGHIEGTIMISNDKYKPYNKNKNNLNEILIQFIGKRIGVPSKGSIHDVILRYYLNKFDLHDKIKIKNYPHAEFIALDIEKGLLDAGVGTPSLAVFSSTIFKSKIIIPPNKLWAYNPSYGILISEKYLDEKPEMVIKFLEYHKKASYLLNEHPMDAAKLISNSFRMLSPDYIKSIIDISPKYCISLPHSLIKSTMKFVKLLYNMNYIKKEHEIEDIFNFNYVKKVHPEKEHYVR